MTRTTSEDAAAEAAAAEQAPAGEEQAPAAARAPATAHTPAVAPAPAPAHAPAVEQAPVAARAPAGAHAPTTEQAPAAAHTSAAEQAPAAPHTPASEQAPAPAAEPAAAAPRRGRPRSEAAEQAIVGAVLRLLEQGYPLALLSIEGIAGEAGVGKATIYRRWPNKEELLLDILQRLDEPEPPDAAIEGSVRDALVAALEYLRRAALARRSHTSLGLVANELRSMPELYRRYHEQVVDPRRARLRRLLARGVERGEIRADTDLDLLGELFIGPMLSRTLLRPGAPLEDPTLSATIVDTLLQGLGPQPVEPAAGPSAPASAAPATPTVPDV